MSKLHKNAIITGCIDSYCLVCENHLRSEEDANSHIEKPVHKKNLDSAQYMESHKNDRIRKVKKGYFCEICNILFSMVAKAILHISDAKHIANRGAQLLRRVGNSVISSDNVFINEKAWNGIIENTCALCNTEFFNDRIHKTEPKHILNLVQKEVVFDADGNIYRKIDDSSFQCLICNMIYAMSSVTTHFVDDDHMKCLVECQEFQQPSPDNEAPQTAPVVKNPVINIATGYKTKAKTNIKSTKSKNSAKTLNNNVEPKLTKKPTEESETSNENGNYEIKSCGCVNMETMGNKGDKKLENEKKIQSEDDIFIKNVTSGAQPCKINNTGENTTTSIKVKSKTQTDEPKREKMLPEKVETAEVLKASNTNEDAEKLKLKKQSDKQKILDNVSDFQKNGININFETQTAYCKKCTLNLDFNSETFQKHIVDHKIEPNTLATASVSAVDPKFGRTILKNEDVEQVNISNDLKKQANKIDENHNIKKDDNGKPNTVLTSENNKDKSVEKTAIANGPAHKLNEDLSLVTAVNNHATNEKLDKTTEPLSKNENKDPNTATDEDPTSFAKENNLTYNKGNNVAFCRLCDSRIPSSFRSMKEHVAGAAHKVRASKLVKTKPKIPKKSMKKFITSCWTIQNVFVHDVVVNEKYCLTRPSFMMITEHGNRLRCQVCEVNLLRYEVEHHGETVTHELAMDATPVVWNLDAEFIREVREGLFHCGFCNLIVGCYEDVSKHLACGDHSNKRSEASRRLRDHLPDIHEHRQIRERQMVYMYMAQRNWMRLLS